MTQMMTECGNSSGANGQRLLPGYPTLPPLEWHFDRLTTDPRAYQVVSPPPFQGGILEYLALGSVVGVLTIHRLYRR